MASTNDTPVSSTLTQLYKDKLGRAPDANGAAFWQAQLDAGFPPEEISAIFERDAAKDAGAINRLADAMFAAQVTGVSAKELEEAKRIVHLDPKDDAAATAFLTNLDYKPGTFDFYEGTNQKEPEDKGLNLYYKAAQTAKNEYGYLEDSESNLNTYKGKIDPNTGEPYRFMTRDSVANGELIRSGLEASGLDPRDSTIAFTPLNTPSWLDLAPLAYTKTYGTPDQGYTMHNALQWSPFLKKELEASPTYTAGMYNPADQYQLPFGTVPAGPPVDAGTVPQNVVQEVTAPSYYVKDTSASTSIPTVETGTFSKPLDTAGLSAVPRTVAYKTHYAGTPGLVDPTLYAPTSGSQQVIYRNNLGQQLTITEVNGVPVTYVPPGFTKVVATAASTAPTVTTPVVTDTTATVADTTPVVTDTTAGYAEGGSVENKALFTIAKMNGYVGTEDSRSVRAFMNSSEGLRSKARSIGVAMSRGGYVKGYAEGGDTMPFSEQLAAMTRNTISQTMQPMQAPVQYIQPQAADFIPVDAGQTLPAAPYAEAATVQTVQQAQLPTVTPASTTTAATVAPQVATETAALTAAQGTVAEQAQVTAAQQQESSVTGMQAAQGVATMVNAPAAREIEAGELISGVADAEKAAAFSEQIQAATATPTKQATVAGQLENLMTQFEGGNTPAWAAGSMRAAMANLSARGLGASSMAGQAVIQATMEAALPIAQMDAQTMAQFESQNLSNRQQRAMLSAQQRATFLGMEFDQAFQARVANSARIGDVANMNFTAEQNIALENSRAANTMNLNNLSNRQALVMAEAAALSNLDMANLNNRQQTAVQNAQNFLQMDLTNLSNEQQTSLFKSQQNIQALFTDQAAENASRQFNASSENQTKQFFANLSTQTSQFNASQQNAMDQFNVNSVNALREFNSQIQQQRDLFNAQNGLVIAQSNAQWRQNVSTFNATVQNESNSNFAKTMNAFTSTNLDAYWQRERDLMSFAYASAESAADRMASVLLAEMSAESKAELADNMGKGALTATLLKGAMDFGLSKLF